MLLSASGFFPGETALERIDNVVNGGPELWAVMPEALGRTAAFLRETAELTRARFGGRITYASGTWENVDWRGFDVVAVDAYRDANNRDTFRDQVRGLFQHGKPVVVTEFGSCTYRGAADRGGLGWAVVDWETQSLKEPLVRDELEQVRYATELLDVFEDLGVDTAFWFTFAGYALPFDADPRRDLDMASYGVVKMTPYSGPYSGLPWERKAVFDTLASSNAGNRAARTSSTGESERGRVAGLGGDQAEAGRPETDTGVVREVPQRAGRSVARFGHPAEHEVQGGALGGTEAEAEDQHGDRAGYEQQAEHARGADHDRRHETAGRRRAGRSAGRPTSA